MNLRVKDESFWLKVREAAKNAKANGTNTVEEVCKSFGVTSSGLYYASARFGWLPKTAKRAYKRAKGKLHLTRNFIEVAPVMQKVAEEIIIERNNYRVIVASLETFKAVLKAMEGK